MINLERKIGSFWRMVLIGELLFLAVLGLIYCGISLQSKEAVFWYQAHWFWLLLLVVPWYFVIYIRDKRWNVYRNEAPPRLRVVLWRLVLGGLIIALAQPVSGKSKVATQTVNKELVIAVDVSNSMNAMDLSETDSRLKVSKRMLTELVNGISGAKVGLSVFAGNAYPQLPLTRDYRALKLYLGDLDSRMVSRQGTNLDAAIRTSLKMFQDESAARALVVVSDGEDHEDFPEEALNELQKANVGLFVVGIGSKKGGLIPVKAGYPEFGYKRDDQGQVVISKMDKKRVKEMAKRVGGVSSFVESAFPDISELLTEINRVKGENSRALELEIEVNYFRLPLGLSLILMIWMWSGPWSWIRRRKMGAKNFTTILLLLMVSSFSALAQNQPQSRDDWRAHLELARAAYASKQFNAAWLHYENAMLSIPEDVDISSELAQTKFRLKEAQASMDLYKKQIEKKPKNQTAHYNLGTVALEEKDYDLAVNELTEAVLQNPNDADALYNLSRALEKQKQDNKQKPNPQENKEPNEPENNKQDQQASLSENAVDRILKEIMKQEANTKRKLGNDQKASSSKQKGKDW